VYRVDTGQDISGCVYSAQIADTGVESGLPGYTRTGQTTGSPDVVTVATFALQTQPSTASPADYPFHLLVACP
jgi:hypothetical protein